MKDLLGRYPEWLLPERGGEKQGFILPDVGDRSGGEFAPSIDLNTILKASLELAHETNLEELLRRLMDILFENAGAQKGALILLREDRWFLEVQGSTDPENRFAFVSTPLEEQGAQVPLNIVYYVINSEADVVLENASGSLLFGQDRYIRRQRPKSVLCAPLLNQGVLSGVVYLENNLAAGAFTADRLEIVQLISGQAAVSIENARLYATMDAQVKERTRELAEANQKLRMEIEGRNRFEEALWLSEERYRTVFENTGTAMMVVDWDGTIRLANEELTRLTGYLKEELEGRNAQDLATPEELPVIRQRRAAQLVDPAGAP
ncbi:MAG TPA: GAF domain-containing protein, partial [Candidatus Acidoferrum sp.]|nr:GAF domain-containing protein [Candidatus Acidoferrum sp.]